jgi:hypothetical protein
MSSSGGAGASTSPHTVQMGVSRSPTRESPLSIDSLNALADSTAAGTADAPSTSPTSSYPLSNGMSSSPLNPATSAHSHANDTEAVAPSEPSEPSEAATVDPVSIPGTTTRHPGTVDFTTVVPGIHKSDLPTSATPKSGEEADTDPA